MVKFCEKLRKKEDGVFTLEASILFPIILIITMTFIFFSLVMYQKSVLHYSANMVAERLAFAWDNSDKDLDGTFDKYTTFDGGDGLYWRLTDNQYLSQFGLDFFSTPSDYTVNLGSGGSGLPGKKLGRASSDVLPPGATGEVRYENGIFGSQIVVEMESPLNLPGFVQSLFGIDSIEVEVSHTVIEPTEFIRSTDLVIYAMESIREYASYITDFMNYYKK